MSSVELPKDQVGPAPGRAPAAGPSSRLRQRIVKMAEEHFLARGFRAITMAELAAELGVSKKTLYRHFTAKQALLDAVLAARVGEIRRELDALAGDLRPDFAAKLSAVLGYLSRRLGEVKPPFMLDLKRHAPDSFKRIETYRRQTIPRHFGRFLAEGTRLGLVRPELPPPIVVEVMLNLVQTLVPPEALTRLNVSAHEAFSTILSVVFEGILTPKGRQLLARNKARAGG